MLWVKAKLLSGDSAVTRGDIKAAMPQYVLDHLIMTHVAEYHNVGHITFDCQVLRGVQNCLTSWVSGTSFTIVASCVIPVFLDTRSWETSASF